jgi:DNA-binding transcriptional regulator YiaG
MWTSLEETAPEFDLWIAVLEQAIKDLKGDVCGSYAGFNTIRNRKAQAVSWFYSKQDGVGSFKWLCDQFGANSQELRDKIFKSVKSTAYSTPIAQVLLEYRHKKGLSQGELARRVKIAQSVICNLERGRSFPVSDVMLGRIMDVVGS